MALTKPRIIELLLITTTPTQIVAARGWPGWQVVIATFVGGALSAGGANAINMYVDRDIDRLMPRTQHRPLVTGQVTPRAALTFAIVLEAVAVVLLGLTVNWLSALLALSAALFYVFVYTLWLKRTSTSNIVVGGAAGAVPVLVGWASVTNALGVAPWLLFVAMFLWTPPHFWALAIRYSEDYRAADVPMLPTVEGPAVTAQRMLVYTVALWASTLAFWPAAHLGWLYGTAAIVLGLGFTIVTADLRREPTAARSMRVFGLSITYITVLFAAMAVDVWLVSGAN